MSGHRHEEYERAIKNCIAAMTRLHNRLAAVEGRAANPSATPKSSFLPPWYAAAGYDEAAWHKCIAEWGRQFEGVDIMQEIANVERWQRENLFSFLYRAMQRRYSEKQQMPAAAKEGVY